MKYTYTVKFVDLGVAVMQGWTSLFLFFFKINFWNNYMIH